jgi:thioredoxin reductase
MAKNRYEVIIIGGGPAGLNAAIILGRCRRKILVFDSGKYRNRVARGVHGFLTRDGIPPLEFHRLAKLELNYYNIPIVEDEIEEGYPTDYGFEVIDKHGNKYECKKLLLATGLRDNLPDIPGVEECYGTSVHHCPYCDGWENQDKKIAVYSKTLAGYELALNMFNWSQKITVLTDGANYLKEKHTKVLDKHKIRYITTPIKQLIHEKKYLKNIEFRDGSSYECEAFFFSNGFDQRSKLGVMLGCKYTTKGVIVNDKYQHTSIKNLFVAGDAAQDMQFVVVAAAEGAKAAVTINKELTKERVKEKLGRIKLAQERK